MSTDNTVGAALDKEDFLKILVTQLQNQDPTNPLKSEAFASQLAQFSALEQMQNLNESFGGFAETNNITAGASLTGKNVEFFDSILGTNQTGIIDKVIFDKDGMKIEIGGVNYPATNIKAVLN